jgi:hypothetical protein
MAACHFPLLAPANGDGVGTGATAAASAALL